jgi:hypothetical protein
MVIKTNQSKTYTAKVAVCSEIRTKHSTQSERYAEFLILNLVVRKETIRLLKVNSGVKGLIF